MVLQEACHLSPHQTVHSSVGERTPWIIVVRNQALRQALDDSRTIRLRAVGHAWVVDLFHVSLADWAQLVGGLGAKVAFLARMHVDA